MHSWHVMNVKWIQQIITVTMRFCGFLVSRIPFLILSYFLDFFFVVKTHWDFSLKSEEVCDFFDKRGYPASIVQAPNKLIDSQHYKRRFNL